MRYYFEGHNMVNSALEKKLAYIGDVFRLEGSLCLINVLTSGNVNSTYKIDYRLADGTVKSYVTQRINPYVFRFPKEVMRNIDLVTSHIRNKLEAHQVALHFHHTADRKNYYIDEEDGALWRLYTFIPAVSYNTCDDLTVLHNAGEAFGRFQMQLSDFDASLLFETIPDFHNTPKRLATLFCDVDADPCGRVCEVREEIERIRTYRDVASTLYGQYEKGELPLRVTHNDTKINNVLFDAVSKRPLTVIDLDTVMPGLAMYDFGDAVRFAASTAAEDEADLSVVGFDLNKYRAFAEGFITPIRNSLTKRELDSMALGAITITAELASRFLDDYLLGDNYFKVNYEGHNLVRARCQLCLLDDMMRKYDDMRAIIDNLTKE